MLWGDDDADGAFDVARGRTSLATAMAEAMASTTHANNDDNDANDQCCSRVWLRVTALREHCWPRAVAIGDERHATSIESRSLSMLLNAFFVPDAPLQMPPLPAWHVMQVCHDIHTRFALLTRYTHARTNRQYRR
jgi:hypothetical protein